MFFINVQYHVWIRNIEIDDQLNIDDSDHTELFDKVDDNITGLIKFNIEIVKNDDDDYNKYYITNSNDNNNTDFIVNIDYFNGRNIEELLYLFYLFLSLLRSF